MKSKTYKIIYTWQNGRKEIRYTRPRTDVSLAKEVLNLQRVARRNGNKSQYSIEQG